MGGVLNRLTGIAGATALALGLSGVACAQTAPAPATHHAVDAQTQAVLFGAAYANSDLSSDQGGGMMFLPGRGLIRWETKGKTLAEQEEAKIEAIGAADARAVQAEIDARAAATDLLTERAGEAMVDHDRLLLSADRRAVPALELNSVTGTGRHAGGVVALNKAARAQQIAESLGIHDGVRFKGKNRLYIFGAVSGRGIGMNLLHDQENGWTNAGLSSDKGGFIGQRQAGLAWRNGRTQAAISYVQEKTYSTLLGLTSIKDHRAMINFTFTPEVKPVPAPPTN